MPIWRHTSQPGIEHDVMRCVVDEKGVLVFASPAVGWSLGISAETLVQKPVGTILEVVPCRNGLHQVDDFRLLPTGFHEVALLRHERDPVIVPARIDQIDAHSGKKFTVIWLDPADTLMRKKNHDFKATASDFATFIDTQQKPEEAPAEHNILNDDGELRHFLNLTNDLLGVYRLDGSFVRVNPAFNRVLGYSDSELKTFPFIDLIPSEDKAMVAASMQKMLQVPAGQEMSVVFQSRARCKEGSIRWIKWIHKIAGSHIYIVGSDVTDIKQHEAELSRREEQLSEAQKIGHMGHWYWEINQQRMEWSDQIYTIFGVEKGRFIPSVENINSLLLKRDLGRIDKSFREALARRKDYAVEFRFRRPKGGIRFIRCEGRCKIDPVTGQVEALFGIMLDITERTLHERALREAKEAAETAYASKTRFLANMSHELRTPLNAIIGFSEMMQRQLLGPVGNPRYLDYIGGIHQSGEHLLNLINDILDMSKIEVGKYELYVEEINVGKLIRLAVHMVEGRAEEGQVRLVTDDIPEDVQIIADRRALMQILLNLLSNAVKFTNAGGSVEIKCEQELGGVAIIVTDTGVGIPKDKIALVTMPFEQVDSELTRKHEGSGLGLAITKDLIGLHGGNLSIESEIGVGTSVTVLLPTKLPDGKNVKTVAAAMAD